MEKMKKQKQKKIKNKNTVGRRSEFLKSFETKLVFCSLFRGIQMNVTLQGSPSVCITIGGDNYDEMSEILQKALQIPDLKFQLTVDLRELSRAELLMAWPFVQAALCTFAPMIVPDRHSLVLFAMSNSPFSSKADLKASVATYLTQNGITCPMEVIVDW
jgi:hypothetical protein